MCILILHTISIHVQRYGHLIRLLRCAPGLLRPAQGPPDAQADGRVGAAR